MAITIGDNGGSGALTNAGGTVTAVSACSAGNLIIAFVSLTATSSSFESNPPTVTSNVVTGNMILAGFVDPVGIGKPVAYFYGIATSAAIPSVTIGSLAGLGSGAGHAGIAWFKGFTGTPILDSAINLSASGSGTTWSGPSPSSTANPELILGGLECSGANANTDVWNEVTFGGISNVEWAYVVAAAAPPVTDTWSGTLNASVNWSAFTVGFTGAITGATLVASGQAVAAGAGALRTTSGSYTQILLDDPGHIGGSDQINMGTGPGTGTGDTGEVAFTKLKQWAADANANFGKLFPLRSVQTPITGFAISAAVGITQVILNPAGTLATGTVTLPANPADQQSFVLVTTQTITALTVNTSDGTTLNGAPTTQSANTAVRWLFVASINAWVREQ